MDRCSAVAEHALSTRHQISFAPSQLLLNVQYCQTQILKEAIQIQKHYLNMNWPSASSMKSRVEQKVPLRMMELISKEPEQMVDYLIGGMRKAI